MHRNESHSVSHANWINTRILAAYFPCLLKKREITKLTNGKVNKETSLIAFDVQWNKVLDCMKATRQVKSKRFLFDKIVAESNETKCHGKSVCVEKDKHEKNHLNHHPHSPMVLFWCVSSSSVWLKKFIPECNILEIVDFVVQTTCWTISWFFSLSPCLKILEKTIVFFFINHVKNVLGSQNTFQVSVTL